MLHPNIVAKQQYINSKTKIAFVCKECNYEWSSIPYSVIKNGCPKCHKKQRYTTQSFINTMYDINPNIRIIGKYVNNHTKILCECLLDGYQWKARPDNLLRGIKCPQCQNKKSWTTETFAQQVSISNPTVKIIGKYKTMRDKIECECLHCNHKWFVTPSNLLYQKSGCPQCKLSKGEKEVENILKQNKIVYQKQYRIKDCHYKKTLAFDFAVFKHDELIALIEYDGKQHFEGWKYNNMSSESIQKSKEEVQIRDQIKNEYCKNHNIVLVRIPYWRYNQITDILTEHHII